MKMSKILTLKVILYQSFNSSFSISLVVIAQESLEHAKPFFLVVDNDDQRDGLVTVKTTVLK